MGKRDRDRAAPKYGGGPRPLDDGWEITGWMAWGPDRSQTWRGWTVYADPDPARGITTKVIIRGAGPMPKGEVP